MLSTEVMLYLEDQLDFIDLDLTGASGNLFDNAMPPNPDIAFMVENTGGSPQSFTTKKIQEPALRILARGTSDPRVSRGKAQKIIDLIGSFRKGCFAKPEEEWQSGKTYSAKAVVENDGVNYVALTENTDVKPGVDSNWEDYWQELEGTFVHSCQAVQARPINIGRDENDRFRFSTNFELKIGVK